MSIHTARCAACGERRPFPTMKGATDWIGQHDLDHRDLTDPIPQLPGVDWHTRAMTGLLDLCRRGTPFVVSEVIALGVPEAPNPRTDWPRVTNEARDLGWMVPTGRLGHSQRPATKGSPVTEWVGTATVRTVAA